MTDDTTESVVPIEVLGATANNLKGVDCLFPFPGLSAIIGVSGSGKSSLLRETLAAEASRRNTIFLGRTLPGMPTPMTVDAFVGRLPPAVHVGQRPFRASTRTTVGTASSILGELRHLFLMDGAPFTVDGAPVSPPSPETYADWLSHHYRGTAIVWAVPLRWESSDGTAAAARLHAAGIETAVLRSETDRAAVHERGRPIDLKRWKPLNPSVRHALEAEVGRVRVGAVSDRPSIASLLGKAWRIAGPDVIVELPDAPTELAAGPMGHLLDGRRHWVEPAQPDLFRAPDRHLLSFNAPEHPDSGACRQCQGVGRSVDIIERALVPDPSRSVRDGALSLWAERAYKHVNIHHETIEALSGRHGFSPDTPWSALPSQARRLLLEGTGSELIQGIDPASGRKQGAPRRFEGFRAAILRRWGSSLIGAQRLDYLVREQACPACAGSRWSYEARALRAAGRSLAEWLALPMAELEQAVSANTTSMTAATTLARLRAKASIYRRLGLGHIASDRGMQTLSDGEARRLQIGSVLAVPVGRLLLLLDEPARGLHESDLEEMVGVLNKLAFRHAVIVNEHRTGLVRAAQHIVELGPGAGHRGGEIVGNHSPDTDVVRIATRRGAGNFKKWLAIEGATLRTVRSQDLRLPLGGFTAFVGVSGSGKSSIVNGVLIPALADAGVACEGETAGDSDLGSWVRIEGAKWIDRVHVLRQRVPPRNRRSLVATMTNALDYLATAWAASPSARAMRLDPKHFRLGSGGGRCQTCLGTGEVLEDDVGITCPACAGGRYGPEALTPRVAGLDIAATLDQPVAALREQWLGSSDANYPRALLPLFESMIELGVGHLALGRKLDSLSGGEVQRLRIARMLADGRDAQRHLFVLDEPAAGLHRHDTERLLAALHRMTDGGRNTVVLIEHNLHLIAQADWLIEVGPGAGSAGGRVISQGTPTTMAAGDTPTGRALADTSVRGHPPAFPKNPATIVSGSGSPALFARIPLGRIERGSDEMEPAATMPDLVERLLDQERKVWEIGDLHLELAKVAIGDFRDRAKREREQLIECWQVNPGAKLVIAPLIHEMRTWGLHLPRSQANHALARIAKLQLTLLPGSVLDSPERIRLAPAAILGEVHTDGASLETSLALALATGGGHVELHSAPGAVVASLDSTPMALEIGLIAPLRLEPAVLSRFSAAGKCPACAGRGFTRVAAQDLLVQRGEIRSAESAQELLTGEAAALLKGLWRTEAAPFFRRLEQEGLAPDDLRETLLSGYWQRPGAGTFLKKPQADPDEVASWLRWDGLYRYILSDLPRSRHGNWAKAVLDSVQDQPCPVCAGSGHRGIIRLIELAGRSLADWLDGATVKELADDLDADRTVRDRRRSRTVERVLACLAPLVREAPHMRLDQRVDATDPLFRRVADTVLNTFVYAPTAR